ncbi:MAG: divergent PAP2 family protein [Firmicutes bacterium]|nr:divergent PAP2 family protein [Bacillota bacterium]
MWLSAFFRGLAHNPAIIAALASIVIAQVIKVPIFFFSQRKWDFSKMFSTGGMPSSHSAAVCSLATVVGSEFGTGSTLFGACVVFGVIVMYDAAGIRRHAGEQAIVLNQLEEEIGRYIDRHFSGNEMYQKKLKEMLGHQPIEVFMGAVLGIVLGVIAASVIHTTV